MMKHGIPENQIVQTTSPYQPSEITSQFDPEGTSVVFAVGKKDMDEDPRFANLDGLTKRGHPSYYKKFDPNQELLPLDQHGYIDVAPHVSIDIPGIGEMSGTSLRKSLANADPDEFELIMGWFDPEVFELLQGKLEEASGAAAVGGFSLPLGMKPRYPEVAGSEKKKKRHPKNFLTEEDEMVNEVMNYLLSITVG
jgi:hypothetical protein